MGKKQKNRSEESAKDDIDIDALAAEIEGAGAAKDQEPQKSKGKKKKEKKKQDFDEDDILKELEELSIEAQGGKVDREQPSTGKVENDNEESLSKQDKKRKGKSKKANLENDYDSEEVEDKDKKSKKTQKTKQDMLSGSDDDDHETQLKKSKGKTQKSNKKHDLSEDETNIKKSKERGGGVSTGESGDESDEVSQSRKRQKKNQKPKSAPAAESGDDEEEPSFKLKTAAQKKAEKKERERKKREEEKAKLRKQKEKEELEGGKEPAKPKESLRKAEEKASPEATAIPGPREKGETPAGAEADDNEGDKKKKDKKKKKGEKEEKEKEKKKGPSKATVKAMQEALAKMKEEEERAKREEEERIRRLEELEAKRKEEERLEQERKERKKQKEKERKERLKKEGKLLTKTQREARARAEATLKLLQAQGVEVPSKDSVPKKRPIYEDKKRKKQQQPENKEESVEVTSPAEDAVELETPVKEETPLPAEPVSEEKEEEDETEDAGLDDWEAMVSDEDGEKESKPVHIEVKEQNEVDEEEEEDDEEEEEEEESEESEDSEGSEDEDEKTSDEREADSQAIGKQSMEKKPSKEISSDSEYDSDDDRTKEERAYDKAKRRIEKRRAENSKNMNTEKLRAPVICVLGHVDTGKTKILDKLRHTHVQDSEAGGITQQIGATNVPLEAINEQTKMVKNFDRENIKIPGMLIIDTPGHESFSNLRNRGSSLCDIAILVVDIMHGLEPQTIESINLLKSKKCPFIVALNKIDRLYDWKKSPDTDVAVTLKKQKKNTKDEFEERAKAIIVEFAKQGLNAALFYENKDPRTFVSLVPTSAHTGDGMGSLIALLVELTQTMLTKRLAECQELRAQVMEVKALPGMGTTIDVILINGRLREGDTIIVPGVEGPIVTQIRGLLLPPPMKELRVKNQYEKHKEVVAAQGVKILGKDLEKTLAGLPLLVAHKEDEVPVLKDELIHELKQTLNAIKLEEKGVYVQASTLGSLEALLEFLKTSEVPYSGINIGPVHKKDVMKASVMLEHDPQYAVILAFDVRIERDAQEMADSLGVRIFSAEIIYHLFDAFTKYRQDYKKQKQEEFKHIAVFPCKLKILPQFIFNSRDPIVMGVVVEAGQVKQGTPMCVPSKNFVEIGIVTSIEINHKPVDVAKKGQEVCVKIEPIPGESPKMYGRHFEATDILVSKISRQSIDALKDWFRDEMQKSDWQLIVELKKVFEII
ncbi:eukaryotic translation initiation factor 5B isoform X2 [Corvus hawaiiensis]|uniref:eukaryotic translation initiation factor 5B isoform X2 n=1 Tax=Corvus moneduloides TaxID=1196302 RepID=UPI0013624B5D|nr:eukaryotic translation initiation factor 5B isoform X2 [Corvus moneduloides]XP_048181402.1 eukaryotic translation initiation factor 5B isoform X2 [Corvus hawaiiensis]